MGLDRSIVNDHKKRTRVKLGLSKCNCRRRSAPHKRRLRFELSIIHIQTKLSVYLSGVKFQCDAVHGLSVPNSVPSENRGQA